MPRPYPPVFRAEAIRLDRSGERSIRETALGRSQRRAGGDLPTLLGSPPRPCIARCLLIGRQRPAATSLKPVCPRGLAGSADSCVVLAPRLTRGRGP